MIAANMSAQPSSRLASVLQLLTAVRRCGARYSARCPAHEDHSPSLSIAECNGRILLKCHAGCTSESIVRAVGLAMADLFTDNEPGAQKQIVAIYDYTDEAGTLLCQNVRYEPKDFRWRRPDVNGDHVWDLKGVRRVPYEGEKDADAVCSLGFVASSDGAASQRWPKEWSEMLRGKNVTIIPDGDEPGRKHAQQVVDSLLGKAAAVRVLELPGAKDVTDWLEKGGTREQLELLIREAKEWMPGQESVTARIVLVPADDFLARTSNDERPWLAEGLLPAGSQTIWQGRPKVGKSHSLLQLAFDLGCGRPAFGRFAVTRPIRTAYVELEEPEAITKSRFGAMLRANGGNGPDAEHLSFFTRQDLWRLKLLPRELSGSHLQDFITALRDKKIELLILVALRSLLTGKPGDAEVAERLNDTLDILANETQSALALAHHSRKEAAETVEAQGFGSTMLSARADATFDMGRSADGYRRIRAESRFPVSDVFFLRKEVVGDGELIRWAEPPVESKRSEHDVLVHRVGAGESVHKVSTDLGVPYSTAKRWATEANASL